MADEIVDVDINTIVYIKLEVDQQRIDDTAVTDAKLDLKIDSQEKGSPVGVGTLDVNGKHTPVEIPFSTQLETDDPANIVTVINPSRLHYLIDKTSVPLTAIGAVDGIAPLGPDQIVPAVNLPPVERVQLFSVGTLVELHALIGVDEADRGFVTADPDPANNGEWVADINNPTSLDWSLLPNFSYVVSVNGETGVINITSITESAANAGRLDIVEPIVTDLADDKHLIYTWNVVDQTAMDLITPVAGQEDALLFKADDRTYFEVVSTAPTVWNQVIFTAAQDKVRYEALPDTNPFTDADAIIVGNISSRAGVNERQLGSELAGGGLITIDPGGITFSIATAHIHFADTWSTPIDEPLITHVDTAVFSNISPEFLLTSIRSVITINSVGALVQFANIPSGENARDYVVLGVVVHSDNVNITGLSQVTQGVSTNISGTFSDFREAFGTINVLGNLYSPAGLLTIKKSYGEVFGLAQNFKTNAKDPNKVSTPATDPQSFLYTYQDGIGGWNIVSAVDIVPGLYDIGTGVLGAVPVNNWTAQPIWLATGSGTTIIGYGQALYSTAAEAIAAIGVDTTAAHPLTADLVLRGWVISRGGATDLTDPLDGTLYEAAKFGGVAGSTGISTATLQETYNNSSNPEILTDATRGALTLKEGTGVGTANVYEGQNNAGATTFSVDGNGLMTLLGAPVYADDAAAATGGLVTGNIYQTVTGELRIKL